MNKERIPLGILPSFDTMPELSDESIADVLTWLVAFNDACFDNVDPEDVAKQLDILVQHTRHTDLRLDSPREQWSDVIASCLSCPERKTQA